MNFEVSCVLLGELVFDFTFPYFTLWLYFVERVIVLYDVEQVAVGTICYFNWH